MMSIPWFVSERSKPELTVRPLSVGCLIFEQMDQTDFTGPLEVLSRMPDTTIRIIGKELSPVHEVQGLRFSPDVCIAKQDCLMSCSSPAVMGSRRDAG